VFIALVVVSMTLITFDLRASEGAGFGDTLREGFQTVFEPVQRGVSAVTRPIVGFFEGIADLASLRDENRELREEVAELEQEMAATEALERQVRELEEIVGIEPPEGLESVVAQVLAVGPSEFDHIRLIDRGRDDGVTVDMPVIDEGGLVGRVVAVTDTAARVRLITDPTMKIAVRVERTGEIGYLVGHGNGPMVLEMINTNAVLVEGDLLVTAGSRYPAGISVARVAEAARAELGFTLRTTAFPTAEVTRIDYVEVLIFTSDEIDIAELEEEEDVSEEVPPEQVEPTEGGPEEAPGTTEPSTTLAP
jgi:rod shape-determining protein MreC